jgi:diguanylate cyclase (GGDEF)-like protein
MAAALVLPAALVALTVAGVFLLSVLRGRRHRNVIMYRTVLRASAATVSATVAQVVFATTSHGFRYGPLASLAVVAATVVYGLLYPVLVLTAVYLAVRPARASALRPKREATIAEIASLVLGAVTAVLLTFTPCLALIIFVLLAALQRAALVQRLQIAATTDSKTGLLNAGSWHAAAQRILDRAARTPQPCAVLLLDIDHFKFVNDTRGHAVGDTTLVALAECMRRLLRGPDVIGRFGGEEFVAFLPTTGVLDAVCIAERLRAAIHELEAVPGVRVTVSIGVSAHPEHGCDVDQLLATADVALYAAKAAGRNQVASSSDVSVQYPVRTARAATQAAVVSTGAARLGLPQEPAGEDFDAAPQATARSPARRASDESMPTR